MKFYSTISFLLCLFAVVQQQVQAFCVYNKCKNHQIRVTQNKHNTKANDFTSFKSECFETDGKSCCSYTEPGCNYRGLQTEMISVNIDVDHEQIYTVNMQAGGYVEVYDIENTKKVKIVTYTPEGTVVPCSQTDPLAFDKRTSTGMYYDDCLQD